MVAIAHPFGSAAGKYAFLGEATLTNCFAEIREDNGKAKYVIVPSDGSTIFSDVTDTPNRGTIYLDDMQEARTVHSGRSYSVDSAGTATSLGVIPGIDKVRIARNQKTTPQIAYQCAVGIYIEESDVTTKLSDADFPEGATIVDICDAEGHLIVALEDGRFTWSGLHEMTSIDGLDFNTAAQSPDRNVGCRPYLGKLFLFGRQTIQPFNYTGNVDSLWEPNPTSVPRGCAGRWTIVPFDNAIGFLGDDGIYYRLNGLQPTRISNHYVERLIQSEADPSVIEAQTWSRAGHAFVELKGTNWSVVYDANTGQWHNRETYNENTWRHVNAFSAFGKTIVGDKLGGSLYYMDETAYTEADGIQLAKMKCPPLNTFSDGAIVDALHIDYLTGEGLTLPADQGYDPLLMVRLYKDGGHEVAIERHIKLGKRGNRKRVTSRRWGKVKSLGGVFEFVQSDPVGRALAQIDVDVRQLNL
jgi:hypothetical protein